MKPFQSMRVTKTCRQINTATPDTIFPLLCPVREKDWIDGWEYQLIWSVSGVAEKGCIFTTPSPDNKVTTWYITEHDTSRHRVGFVRMTPGEMVVHLHIQLSDYQNGTTAADITYEYTSLSEEANRWIEKELDAAFSASMSYWEKAINHYLQTGNKMVKS